MNLKVAALVGLLASSLLLGSASAEETKYLADRHAAKGMPCTTCHVKNGSPELKLDDKKHESCVACHGWYDKLAKETAPKTEEAGNPHAQHDGNLPCTTCHKGHESGYNYCGECHQWEFEVP